MHESTERTRPVRPPALSLVEKDGILVEERKRDKLLRYAKYGASLMATATHRIATRTLWWGAWGVVLGLVVFGLVQWLGLLAFPWPRIQVVWSVLMGLLYAIAGAGCWGHAGFWRGVGRFVLVLGVDNGWVISLLSALFDRMTALLRKSSRLDRLMDRTELWVGDLPLARWEELLKQGAAMVIGEGDADANGLLQWIRSFVVRQIERYLLRIVRKEIEAGHGGGISMQKVRELAFLRAEEQFQDSVTALMNKQLLAMSGLFLLLATLPPTLAASLQWAIP